MVGKVCGVDQPLSSEEGTPQKGLRTFTGNSTLTVVYVPCSPGSCIRMVCRALHARVLFAYRGFSLIRNRHPPRTIIGP